MYACAKKRKNDINMHENCIMKIYMRKCLHIY